MNILRKSVLIVTAFLFPLISYSQVAAADSLKNVLVSNVPDSTYIQTTLDIAWLYMYTEVDSAVIYANKGLMNAQQNNQLLFVANAYNTLGVCYIVKAEYGKALGLLSKARETCNGLLHNDPNNNKYKRRLLATLTNIGNIYYYQANYENAIENYIAGLKLCEEINFVVGEAICLSNLAASYKDILNYEKALEYNYRSLVIAKQTGDRFSITQSLNNLGSVYFSVPDYDSAYYYFSSCMKLNEEDEAEYELINNYVNIGDVYREIDKYDSALIYFNKSLAICKKLNSVDGLINANYMIGQLYLKTNELELAKDFYKNSLRLATESGTSRFIMLANEQLAEVYKKQHNYQKALEYYIAGGNMQDSIFDAESDARIADAEAKYRTERKEKEIIILREETELQNARSKTNKLIFFSVVTILLLFIVLIIMSYRSYKLSQLAERRKIQQNAERKILDAVIETEYKERKRFAEDLHDGLGVLLSTIRLYINEIEDSSKDEQKNLIKQSNAMLDDAISNARNISNNIMPAALKTSGLESAIRSHGDKISSGGKIKVDVKSVNFIKHHKSSVEITLYRVLTEMINNTLKHSKAKNINIMLTERKNKILITYSDDGIGFDYNEVRISDKRGMGLDNMVSRINSIGGRCLIESSQGKGFNAALEVAY